MWLYEQEAIKVSYQPVKVGGSKHCSSGDIIVLIFHVFLQDYVTEWSSTLWAGVNQGKSLSFQVWWL